MNRELDRARKETYEPPQLVTIDLRPEEAVLSNCKIAGGAGPIAPSCSILILPCSAIGS
jgi:hypothetical protein